MLAGDPTQAVELLETGRAMLWTQALHLRQDLDSLRQRRPDLADRLDTARAVLGLHPTHAAVGLTDATDTAGSPSPDGRVAEQRMLEERRHAA